MHGSPPSPDAHSCLCSHLADEVLQDRRKLVSHLLLDGALGLNSGSSASAEK